MFSLPISSSRIDWLDISKAYGMMLVFYGHLWLSTSYPNDQAWIQNKLIYSFHMPLFFVLAGLASKKITQGFGPFLRNKIVSRIVPVLFFSLLLFFCQVIVELYYGNEILIKDKLWRLLEGFFRGKPYSQITWFLICLFAVEMINYFISPITPNNKRRWLSIFLFYGVGFIIIWQLPLIVELTRIEKNYWYLHEALIAYSFYQFGVVLWNTKWLTASNHLSANYLLLIVSIVILLFTFNRNQGFLEANFRLVLMLSSIHGQPIYFLVSALAGSLAIIFLAMITPKFRILLFWGQNTLVLLGLNGIFRDLINPKFVQYLPVTSLNTHFKLILLCLLITLGSMVVCIPFIRLYNGFYPRFIINPLSKLLSIQR